MIYDDDNGAALVPYHDDAVWPIGRALAAALSFGAAFWIAVGGLLWWLA